MHGQQILTNNKRCVGRQISGPLGSAAGDLGLLGCEAVTLGGWF